jgi:hypothetical protein
MNDQYKHQVRETAPLTAPDKTSAADSERVQELEIQVQQLSKDLRQLRRDVHNMQVVIHTLTKKS